jgi:hypothetical protein
MGVGVFSTTVVKLQVLKGGNLPGGHPDHSYYAGDRLRLATPIFEAPDEPDHIVLNIFRFTTPAGPGT